LRIFNVALRDLDAEIFQSENWLRALMLDTKLMEIIAVLWFLTSGLSVMAQDDIIWICDPSETSDIYGGLVQGGITVEDVDGDGRPEILAGSGLQWLYCINGSDGSIEWVFGPTYQRNLKPPQVADINGDGELEVVFCDDKGGVWAVSGRGGWEIWRYFTGRQTRTTPACGDVNGDGEIEVVVTSDSGVFCIDGTEGKPIWHADTGPCGKSSPVIADLDGDGALEIVAKSYGDTVLLNGTDGTLIWQASISLVESAPNGVPAVYDVNEDGVLDILMCGGRNASCLSGTGDEVLWVHPGVGKTTSGLLVADVNEDGRMEAITTTYYDDGHLTCLDASSGELVWKLSWPGLLRYSNPAVADVTGDGNLDLVVGSLDGSLLTVDGKTGALISAFVIEDDIASSPAVADVDGDGLLDVVFGSHNGKVYALRTPTHSDQYEAPWGIFHCDMHNSGVLTVSEGISIPLFGFFLASGLFYVKCVGRLTDAEHSS